MSDDDQDWYDRQQELKDGFGSEEWKLLVEENERLQLRENLRRQQGDDEADL